MKKYFLLPVITIILFGINKSFAQKSVELGVKAGLSIPDLSSGSKSNPISSGYDSRLR